MWRYVHDYGNNPMIFSMPYSTSCYNGMEYVVVKCGHMYRLFELLISKSESTTRKLSSIGDLTDHVLNLTLTSDLDLQSHESYAHDPYTC